MDKDLALVALVVLGLVAMLLIHRGRAETAPGLPAGQWVMERTADGGVIARQVNGGVA